MVSPFLVRTPMYRGSGLGRWVDVSSGALLSGHAPRPGGPIPQVPSGPSETPPPPSSALSDPPPPPPRGAFDQQLVEGAGWFASKPEGLLPLCPLPIPMGMS